MATREPGKFRIKVFGGFHQKDVLAYIKTLYSEMDQVQADYEDLRQRCIELENLIQNLEKAKVRGGQAGSGPTLRVASDKASGSDPLSDPELMSVLDLEQEPIPVEESVLEPAQEPLPEPVPVEPPFPKAKPSLAMPPGVRPAKVAKVKVQRM